MKPTPEITPVASLQAADGGPPLQVLHAQGLWLSDLVPRGVVDAAVMGSDFGFAPLRHEEGFLTRCLLLAPDELFEVAEWSGKDETPTLVTVPPETANPAGLKALVIAPSENSRSYARFATPGYGRPSRDFYYNVAYESLKLATTHFGARRVAMSHLSVGSFHGAIATCAVEAAAHLRNSGIALEALVFFGCCIGPEHMQDLVMRANELGIGTHREIEVIAGKRGDFGLMKLRWPTASTSTQR